MEQKTFLENIKENKFYIQTIAVYTFLFLFFCSKLSPLYPSNEWADVNVYFNIGKAIFNGRTLYTESFDPKGPLIFIIYGIGYLISSTTFGGVFIFYFLAWTVALFFIFLTARRLLKGQSIYAFIVSILTPVFAIYYMHSGGSVEELILIFQLISICIFILFFTQSTQSAHNPKYMLVLGITTAAIFFLKLNLTAFCLFPLLGIFLQLLINKQFKQLLTHIVYYIIGATIITLPICVYLYMNEALQEAYNIYIVLNMNLTAEISLGGMISVGVARIYDMFKENLIGALLMFIGAFYFPFKFLNSIIGKVSFILGACSLIFFIFFGSVYHYYYPLPFMVFAPMGLILVASFLEKVVLIKYSKKLLYFNFITALLLGITFTKFFDMGGLALLHQSEPHGVGYEFSRIIKKEKNPTLLNLAYGDTNNIYTLCNIVPNTRYFTALNIPQEKYPQLRDEQTKYIENKEVQFVVMNDLTPSVAILEYFGNLEALNKNYSLISTYVGEEVYQLGKYDCTTYLYKRND